MVTDGQLQVKDYPDPDQHQDWVTLKHGFDLGREMIEKDNKNEEVVHETTILSLDKRTPKACWSKLERLGHRKWTTAEDASRIRKGLAPQLMTVFHNSIPNGLHDTAATSVECAI
jgi:hypothetical protein